MPEYKASTEIDADPDAVFDYLADVGHLPDYFDRMTSAEPGDGREVHVIADLGDRTVEGSAWFEVDRAAHTLAWGSEGPNDYHGRLNVSERGTGALVSVVLNTERGAGEEIRNGIQRTLDNVKRLTGPQ